MRWKQRQLDVEDMSLWTKRMSVVRMSVVRMSVVRMSVVRMSVVRMSVVRMSVVRMNPGAETRPFHEVEGAGYWLISYKASIHDVSNECKA